MKQAHNLGSCVTGVTGAPDVRTKAAGVILSVALLAASSGLVHAQANQSPAPSGAELELPLSGPAFKIADEAYEAFGKGDYETAIDKVREAIRQRPDVGRLKLLLIDALEASGRYDEAEQTADELVKSGETSAELTAQLSRIRTAIGQQAIEAVYRALERRDFDVAVAEARKAIALNPDNNSYRHLLIISLLRKDDFAGAEAEAMQALEEDPQDNIALMYRGSARQRLGQVDAAESDFDAAIAQDWLSTVERDNLRLIAVDYALTAGHLDRAATLLGQVAEDNEGKPVRLSRIDAARQAASPKDVALPLADPQLDCRVTPYGRACSLIAGTPPADAGYFAANEAYRALDAGNYELAAQKAQEAIDLVPDNPAYKELLTVVDASRKGGAFEVADEAYKAFAQGDYDVSIEKAREAIRMLPNVEGLRNLLVNALEAAGKLDEARKTAEDLKSAGYATNETSQQIERINKRMAEQPAKSAYEAYTAGELGKAQNSARLAISLAPDMMSYHQLLIKILLDAGDLSGAIKAADEALEQDDEDVGVLLLSGYAHQRAGEVAKANEILDRALAQDWLSDDSQDNLKVIAADYAMAVGDLKRAEAILGKVSRKGKETEQRLDRIRLIRDRGADGNKADDLSSTRISAPPFECQMTVYGLICQLMLTWPPADAGYYAANEAYKAANARDYELAIAKAREAIQLAPHNPAYRDLLNNVLAAKRGGGGGVASPAAQAAQEAYLAYNRGNMAAVVRHARRAVRLAPDNRSYRVLLINGLIAASQFTEARQELETALARFGTGREFLQQSAQLHMQAGKPALAADDFERALALAKTLADKRILRLGLIDAAISANQPQRALAALDGFGPEDSYAVTSRKGAVLFALNRREEALAAFAQAVRDAPTPADRDAAIRAQIGALADMKRTREARGVFSNALAQGHLSTLSGLDMAYLAVRAGDTRMADEQFQRVDSKGDLRGTALIDAAYAARRAIDNERAVSLLKRAIDAHHAGELPLEPQYLYGLRREVSELSRTWGAYVGVSHGAVGVMPGGGLMAQPSGGKMTQSSAEVYWRPPVIGYRDGAIFEVFARNFTTLDNDLGGSVGFSTMQGSVGARWKPFRNYNLMLEASRLFRIGRDSREDTLLRVAFSESFGTDLRVDVPSWWTGQAYVEAARYIDIGQNILNFEARAGHSFRLDAISPRLVVTPFLAIGGGFDNMLATKWALGAGPGINMRYWFREDLYSAPMSYLDMNLQYRFKLDGDDRAEGLFAGMTVAY